MREFQDDKGATWVASVEEKGGADYKGRYGFLIKPKAENGVGEHSLEDICWNSAKTAERTLATMSEAELRRRLSVALGRKG